MQFDDLVEDLFHGELGPLGHLKRRDVLLEQGFLLVAEQVLDVLESGRFERGIR